MLRLLPESPPKLTGANLSVDGRLFLCAGLKNSDLGAFGDNGCNRSQIGDSSGCVCDRPKKNGFKENRPKKNGSSVHFPFFALLQLLLPTESKYMRSRAMAKSVFKLSRWRCCSGGCL